MSETGQEAQEAVPEKATGEQDALVVPKPSDIADSKPAAEVEQDTDEDISDEELSSDAQIKALRSESAARRIKSRELEKKNKELEARIMQVETDRDAAEQKTIDIMAEGIKSTYGFSDELMEFVRSQTPDKMQTTANLIAQQVSAKAPVGNRRLYTQDGGPMTQADDFAGKSPVQIAREFRKK